MGWWAQEAGRGRSSSKEFWQQRGRKKMVWPQILFAHPLARSLDKRHAVLEDENYNHHCISSS